MDAAQNLLNHVKAYNPDFDKSLIESAAAFAKTMHEGQTRASGEPYYTHPLEVAGILADMKMDTATILTAILHDTLEDTPATYKEISTKFGKEVADLTKQIVDGHVRWNAGSNPSGVYIVKAISREALLTGRIVLMR